MTNKCALIFLCAYVQAGTLTRGDVAAFLAQTYQLEGSAGTLTSVSGQLLRVQAAVTRIASVLSEKVSTPLTQSPDYTVHNKDCILCSLRQASLVACVGRLWLATFRSKMLHLHTQRGLGPLF